MIAMRRSFVRLVVSTVLLCWVVGGVIVFAYARSLSWTDERAREEGVFLIHALLDETPAAEREARLGALRSHTSVPLALMPRAEVERRVGRPARPGEAIPLRASAREEWYFLVFGDGARALAAGPVNPAHPRGFVPIGVILLILGVPVLAAWIALRVERRLTKVERASQALATGELTARVDDPDSELAASFNEMAERVEGLIRSRHELVQAVSHELGSPLSRLRFHLELLEGRADEARVAAMARELDALDELVAELLSYVQSDDVALDRADFAPRTALSDLAELAQLDADAELEVSVEIPPGARLVADQRLFLRAIENLLRNAVQHARARVRLELEDGKSEVRVTVHDDGPGIEEALREKVTQPFFRPSSERDRRTGGVGLGLAIVQRIVRRHGGALKIGRSPLGGAMVETEWPR